mmetsp:Transcript_33195/g.76603  ORF Transcript_33195/g.76603 Transcript_33195/m.76603 type:complete len:230 (-) Transcript_33195:127-816(-)
MNRARCRTSFDPNMFGPLQNVVVSGLIGEEEDMLTDRTPAQYDTGSGWVLDVGTLERTTKKKLIPYGGLGYIDMKKAFYGTKGSGPLELWLPLGADEDGRLRSGQNVDVHFTDVPAVSRVRSLVICEVNEKRGEEECKLDKDVSYTVGGVASTKVSYLEGTGLAYLKKKVCVGVDVPKEATLSTLGSRGGGEEQKPYLGLSVVVRVVNDKISLKKGACSISHVVWEDIE